MSAGGREGQSPASLPCTLVHMEPSVFLVTGGACPQSRGRASFHAGGMEMQAKIPARQTLQAHQSSVCSERHHGFVSLLPPPSKTQSPLFQIPAVFKRMRQEDLCRTQS